MSLTIGKNIGCVDISGGIFLEFNSQSQAEACAATGDSNQPDMPALQLSLNVTNVLEHGSRSIDNNV